VDEGEIIGNFELLADRRGFERTDGRDFAENRHDLVARNQFAHGGGGFAVLRLVVFGDQFNLFSKHAARRVDFVHGQLRAVVRRAPERRLAAVERRELADLDDAAVRGGFAPAFCSRPEKIPAARTAMN
jgi:hypothetical protein